MNVIIEPSIAYGKVVAPASKSVSHRMLIGAALAGNSKIKNVLKCDDTEATLNCLKNLGAEFEENNDTYFFNEQIKYEGKIKDFYCGESGSTLRFLIPLSLVFEKRAIFNGNRRLIERGVEIYENILCEKGITVEKTDEYISFSEKLVSGEYIFNGNVSSQYVSGLMFALPLLDGDSVIKLLPPIESRSYIDITVSVLKDFGIIIDKKENNIFNIRGNQKYFPCSKSIEGDWSNASFLNAFNYFNGNIEINGLDYDSKQGDKACIDFFEKLDKGYSVVNISDCPDLGPILFVFAAVKYGGKFLGTNRLKNKESDRILAMAEELKKFGVKTEIADNSVTIICEKFGKPKEKLYGHNDHRIVMALSILSSITGGEICGAEAINKSFPNFFGVLKSLGIKIEEVS